jgi:hypothetical protein
MSERMTDRLTHWSSWMFVGLLLLAPAVPAPASGWQVPAQAIERVAEQVVHARREARFIELYGHDLHVKPPTVRNQGGGAYTIYGQISHHRRLQTDEQYYYIVTTTPSGVISHYQVTVIVGSAGGSGWQPYGLVLGMRNLSLRGTLNEVIGREVERYGQPSDWQRAARHVSLAVAREVVTGRRLVPAPR